MAGSNIKILENLINYSVLKNKVISKNIANVGTENYRREDIQFKDVFKDSLSSRLKTSDSKHISINNSPGKNYEVIQDNNSEMVSGINNVDIDNEMSQLAENTMRFKFAARKIGDYYRGLQKAIKGGGV